MEHSQVNSDISNDIAYILAEFDSFLDNVFESPLSSPTSDCSNLTCALRDQNKTISDNNKNENNCEDKITKLKCSSKLEIMPKSAFDQKKLPFKDKSMNSNLQKEFSSSDVTGTSETEKVLNKIHHEPSCEPNNVKCTSVTKPNFLSLFKKHQGKEASKIIKNDPKLKSYDKVVKELQQSKTSKDKTSSMRPKIKMISSLWPEKTTIKNIQTPEHNDPVLHEDTRNCANDNIQSQAKGTNLSMSSISTDEHSSADQVKKTRSPFDSKLRTADELKIKELEEEDLQKYIRILMSTHTAKIAAGIMSVEHRGTKALELWTRRATEGYEGVVITNMTTSWRNGLGFCALIHHFRPDLIEFKKLKGENILENNALAYRVAEQQLGIPALLDAEDMVESEVPDRLSILTYVSQFYQAFSAQGLIGPGGRRSPLATNNLTKKPTSIPSPIPSPKLSKPSPIISTVRSKAISLPPATIQTKTEKTEFKTDKVTMGVRGRREVCFVCSKPVFLAERLSIGFPSQLRHRTCFKCDRCSAQLTLASYYETEKSQFCCETCPDEERSVSSEEEKESIKDSTTRVHEDQTSSDSESDSDSVSSDVNEKSPQETSSSDKSRSLFLRQTLDEGETSSKLSTHPSQDNTNNHSGSNQCGSSAENAAETFPPSKVLDTSQNNSREEINYRSNIVLNRLKIFENNIKAENNGSIEFNKNRKSNLSDTVPNLKEETDVHVTPEDSIVPENKNSNAVSSDSTISGAIDSFTTDEVVPSPPPPKPRRLFIDDINNEELDVSEILLNQDDSETPVKANSSEDLVGHDGSEVLIKPDNSEVLITPESSKVPVIPDSSEVPVIPDSSEVPVIPDSSEVPVIPDSSEVPVIPDSSEVSVIPDSSEVSVIPDSSEVPVIPDSSEVPVIPDSSEVPVIPDSSEVPVIPDSSELPVIPDSSEVPVIPDSSEVPVIPDSSEVSGNYKLPSGTNSSELLVHKMIKSSSDSVMDDTNPFGSTDDEEEQTPVPKIEVWENDSMKYPEEYNPFDSGSETEPSTNNYNRSTEPTQLNVMNQNPFEDSNELIVKKSLNPFFSDEDDDESSASGSKKKIPPPRPPPPALRRDDTSSPKRLIHPPSSWATPPSPSLSQNSSSSELSALRLKKKLRLAPAPPGTSDQGLERDDGLTAKMQKDLKNQTNKLLGNAGFKDSQNSSGDKCGIVTPKSERGQWRRKKGPAPLLPVPEKRYIRKLPMRQVQQELSDIEIKQTELERQGVLLETTIRDRTESPTTANSSSETNCEGEKSLSSISSNTSTQNSIEVEEMILQLFELVNEKNELFRRQTELMYIKREKRLEEEYAELEYQIRCLMLKVPSERTEADIALEEDLISRLVKLVEKRDEIVNCLEMERQREVVEDQSIASHLIKYQEKHIDGIESSEEQIDIKKKKKKIRLLRKKKKKDKEKTKEDKEKSSKIDADKDIDESEKKKKKKNWFKKQQVPP